MTALRFLILFSAVCVFFPVSGSYNPPLSEGSDSPSCTQGNPEKPLPPLSLIYNREVRRWMGFFANPQSSYMKSWLARSYRYFPDMRLILKSKGLPEDLVYVTLVESGLSSHAVSSARAVGYWQFITATARRFGLRVNHWIDERRDFQKSTRAAGDYLYCLYRDFQDWPLSLAGYNMGEARLKELIKKYRSTDFWALSRKPDFPRETAFYVPKILAVIRIMKSPGRYGFRQFKAFRPYRYDVFYAPGGVRLKELAKQASIPFRELQILNPELKGQRISPLVQNHRIRIPKGTGHRISSWLRSSQKTPFPVGLH